MKTANILPQPSVGELWECFERDAVEQHVTSSMYHPHIDVGDVVEIVDTKNPTTIDVCNLRTGQTMRENRYRIVYFYKKLE